MAEVAFVRDRIMDDSLERALRVVRLSVEILRELKIDGLFLMLHAHPEHYLEFLPSSGHALAVGKRSASARWASGVKIHRQKPVETRLLLDFLNKPRLITKSLRNVNCSDKLLHKLIALEAHLRQAERRRASRQTNYLQIQYTSVL